MWWFLAFLLILLVFGFAWHAVWIAFVVLLGVFIAGKLIDRKQ